MKEITTYFFEITNRQKTMLIGGPYYELSFLTRNQDDKKTLITEILSKLNNTRDFELIISKDELDEEINLFQAGRDIDGTTSNEFDITVQFNISGIRKTRLYIYEISTQLVIVNFWFFGSQHDEPLWDQIGLKEEDKPDFRNFFHQIVQLLKPILGTIGYEEDCLELFDTDATHPNEFFKIENLELPKIKERVNRNKNEFEYCWINGVDFGKAQSIEIEA